MGGAIGGALSAALFTHGTARGNVRTYIGAAFCGRTRRRCHRKMDSEVPAYQVAAHSAVVLGHRCTCLAVDPLRLGSRMRCVLKASPGLQ